MRDGKTGIVADFKQDAGPLRQYLNDPDVTEIMVNRYDIIFVEKGGKLIELDEGFENPEALTRFTAAIAVMAGRELNRRHPILDARLPDGSRMNIVIPPVALDGPIVTIRRHRNQALNHRDLAQAGSVDDKLVVLLYQLVRCKQNLLISGGTGSGKTTLLNVLSSFIPTTDRIVTIEDTAELTLHVKNLARMEAKPAIGNDPGVSMHEMVTSALRMRPDRIVVGECRGPEAWDMLLAMNTGHEGSMTTLHSNTAYDALRRLESMVLRSGHQAPLAMIKNDIASTINFVIHVDRLASGKRRVVEVLEVVGRKGDDYDTRGIYKWTEGQGFKSTGIVPRFVENPTHPEMQLTKEFFAPGFKYRAAA